MIDVIEHTAQDALKLNIGNAYYSKWIMRQWPGWLQMAEGLGLSAGFEPSCKSKQHEGQLGLEQWSCSTAAMTVLCCRWAATLKGDGQTKAMALLDSWLSAALPMRWPFLCSTTSTSLAWGPMDVQECKYLAGVEHGIVNVQGLLGGWPELQKGSMRPLAAQNW